MPPHTNNPTASTIRVRRFRQRNALKSKFNDLLSSMDENQMLTVNELLESVILEQIAYQTP